MKRLVVLLLLSALAFCEEKPLTKENKTAIERFFTAELVYSHTTFPMGQRGLTLKGGQLYPSGQELQILLANAGGPACKPGDVVQITKVTISGNIIHFEINGGPVQKQKWYQRVQVGGGNGSVPVVPTDVRTLNSHGSYVDVVFPGKSVPDMTPEQVKEVLASVLDFHATTALEAYLSTVPKKAQEAIQAHKVLVGMDADMVYYALGKPNQKDRELIEGTDKYYEEWIYGAAPADVTFVRFEGENNIVTRVEIVRAGQSPEIRTAKEIDLPTAQAEDDKPYVKPANAPTLKRPGESN